MTLASSPQSAPIISLLHTTENPVEALVILQESSELYQRALTVLTESDQTRGNKSPGELLRKFHLLSGEIKIFLDSKDREKETGENSFGVQIGTFRARIESLASEYQQLVAQFDTDPLQFIQARIERSTHDAIRLVANGIGKAIQNLWERQPFYEEIFTLREKVLAKEISQEYFISKLVAIYAQVLREIYKGKTLEN